MGYRDLREFVKKLGSDGEIKYIDVETDPVLEITEVADKTSKSNGPALFFRNVKGSKFPVAINMFGSSKRMSSALSVNNVEEIANRISDLIKPETPSSLLEKVMMLPKLKELADCIPKTVKTAPCKDVIIKDNPDLGIFPILKCWPQDGGKFITLPMVFTRSLETGARNCGMYRMHVYDAKTTGMHWHVNKDGKSHFMEYKKAGKRMPVAVAIGAEPEVIYSSTAPLPYGVDEMMFAGFLKKKPVEMVKCETVDIEVPASSEIVIEGYIDPEEKRTEGPFGDHTGFYSPKDEFPVFHVTCITHRSDAIYPATVVGKPPMEDCYMAKATERIFLPFLKMQHPEIVDINLPMEGVFHNCAIVSIKKQYPGHARKIAYGLWSAGQMSSTKIIVVVEDDVNIHNLSEVVWRVFNFIDPKRDIFFTEGPMDELEHATDAMRFGSKAGIDGTRKLPEEGMTRPWPDEIKMSDEIMKLVSEKWKEYV